MNIYVGNLAPEVTEEELKQEFAAFGEVTSVSIIKDKYSGQPKGFGFVEMTSRTEGQTAINSLKGKTLKDRTIEVSEARLAPREAPIVTKELAPIMVGAVVSVAAKNCKDNQDTDRQRYPELCWRRIVLTEVVRLYRS